MPLQLEAADLEVEIQARGEVECRQGGEPPSCHKEPILVLPPRNFAMVVDGVYRSALPKPENFYFLKSLALRSILYLCPEEYPEENKEFVRFNGIRVFQFGMEGNKFIRENYWKLTRDELIMHTYCPVEGQIIEQDPVVSMPMDTIMEALLVLIDPRNHPLLIHCKSGKHRTGCLVGCFRILQDWSISSVHEEYRRHAAAKARVSDLSFIEGFNVHCFRKFVLNVIFRIHGFGSQAKPLCHQQNS